MKESDKITKVKKEDVEQERKKCLQTKVARETIEFMMIEFVMVEKYLPLPSRDTSSHAEYWME